MSSRSRKAGKSDKPGPAKHSSGKADPTLEQFLAHLVNERRLSAHTVDAYRRDLGRLNDWRATRYAGSWKRLKAGDARAFASSLHSSGLSGRSIARALSAARSFYVWMRREKLAASDPFAGISAPKSSKRLPRTLSAEQATSLVSIDGDDFISVRDRAIIELMYSSGLRLSELTDLDIDSVDDADATVRVIGKGSKTRIVPVGQHARRAISAWLPIRRGALIDAGQSTPQEKALFISARGTRLGPRAIQQRLRQWAVRCGLPEDVHPHMLRHSFASHMLESSGDLRAVQELLGHANITTTEVYTHLDFQHLSKVYDKAHPRARKRRGSAPDSDPESAE